MFYYIRFLAEGEFTLRALPSHSLGEDWESVLEKSHLQSQHHVYLWEFSQEIFFEEI